MSGSRVYIVCLPACCAMCHVSVKHVLEQYQPVSVCAMHLHCCFCNLHSTCIICHRCLETLYTKKHAYWLSDICCGCCLCCSSCCHKGPNTAMLGPMGQHNAGHLLAQAPAVKHRETLPARG